MVSVCLSCQRPVSVSSLRARSGSPPRCAGAACSPPPASACLSCQRPVSVSSAYRHSELAPARLLDAPVQRVHRLRQRVCPVSVVSAYRHSELAPARLLDASVQRVHLRLRQRAHHVTVRDAVAVADASRPRLLEHVH